jgi:hypothetical protein
VYERTIAEGNMKIKCRNMKTNITREAKRGTYSAIRISPDPTLNYLSRSSQPPFSMGTMSPPTMLDSKLFKPIEFVYRACNGEVYYKVVCLVRGVRSVMFALIGVCGSERTGKRKRTDYEATRIKCSEIKQQ